MISIARFGAVAVAAVMAAGCAHQRNVAPAPAPQYSYGSGAYGSGGGYNSGYGSGYYGNQQAQYQQLGRVQSIEPIHVDARTTGGGAVAGAAVGGLLGHQIDHGSRRDAATLVGVMAGALIGNQIERNNNPGRDFVRVTVRLDSGEVRAYDYAQLGDIRVGDRVRVDPNNQVYRY
jgi:outer membrane lipoprotein SlyB